MLRVYLVALTSPHTLCQVSVCPNIRRPFEVFSLYLNQPLTLPPALETPTYIDQTLYTLLDERHGRAKSRRELMRDLGD